MSERISFESLARLLNNLYRISGIKFALLDADGKELYTASYQTAFCRLIAQSPGGYARCVACDKQAFLGLEPASDSVQYRCHAGLVEVLIPVRVQRRSVAYILFGQILDDGPMQQQWEETARACGFVGDLLELKGAFFRLKQFSIEDIQATLEVVKACVSEARLEGMLRSQALSDQKRLENYFFSRFGEPLTLEAISRDLSMGKSKLAALTREIWGLTPMKALNLVRLEAAKRMLSQSDSPIRTIAESVGIDDYNYFTKVFKAGTGLTPSAYRKTQAAKQDK